MGTKGTEYIGTLKATNIYLGGTRIVVTADQLNALGSRILVANKTGAPLAAGTLVYVNGYDTTLACPTVAKADASNADTLAQYVLPAAIANNASGYAEVEYTITAQDTSLAAAVGSAVYLSVTVPGSWQLSIPTAADHSAQIVGVVKAKNALTGEIRFFPGKTFNLRVGTSDIQDKAVTNAKLADDAKVGSLAALTTTEVASVVGAINEVDSHADAAASTANAAYVKPAGGIPETDMEAAVSTSLGKADTAYQKPGGGIPETDMEAAVSTSLGLADTAYQKPALGIPLADLVAAVQTSLGKADTSLQGAVGFTVMRAKKALQLNGHGTSPVALQTSGAAMIEGGAGPYDFSGVGDGGTIKITPDDLAEDTATFNCAAGKHESGLNPSIDISAGVDNKFKIQVDDDVGGAQTVVLALAGLNSGAAIAAEMQTQIQALGGVYASVTVTYDHAPPNDHYTITSIMQGTGSKVRITPADDHNVTEELKLGTADGGTNTDGTGDAVNWAAVTKGEVATLINGDIAGVTASGAGAVLTVTSSTTGKDSRVLAGNGTLNVLIGCPNGEVDYGAQGMGYASDMGDANYVVLVSLNGTADPTNHGVSVNNRTAAGFDLVSDGATDTDYVDILVIGT